jgi:ABC-2 type transport system ATP-binding protein
MSDNVIYASGLVKSFGSTRALDGVDLDVRAGEVYGFIGPNGAGKSTTIRALLGVLKPDAGEARVFGQDVWRDAVDIHKRIAYVPGDVNLWDNLTGGEIIDLFIRLRRGQGKQYKQELIEKFDFDPTKKSGTYSKGNRQKVALVAAFASDADLYILDEPTSGLDPLMELVFQDCVAKVKSEGKTILLSSHILSEVEKLCDRLSIIRKGKIIDTGTLGELRHLSRNNITVETENPVPDLRGMKGVYDVAEKADAFTFRVDGDVTGAVMNVLAAAGITHITVTPPTLEELFLSHYGGGDRILT